MNTHRAAQPCRLCYLRPLRIGMTDRFEWLLYDASGWDHGGFASEQAARSYAQRNGWRILNKDRTP